MDLTEVKLPDEAFWSGGNRALDPLVRRYKTEHFGVLLDAPRLVVLGQRDTLPLFAYYMGSFAQMATRDFESQGYLVAVDTDRNRLYWGPAIQLEPEALPFPAIDPAEPMPPGFSAHSYTIDLRERLAIPWKPVPLAITAVMLDMRSNTVESQLARSAGVYEDPEVLKYLEAERAKGAPPSISPPPGAGRALPTYRNVDGAPGMPKEIGIELAADRVAVRAPGSHAVLRGAFRLPVRPEEAMKSSSIVQGVSAVIGIYLFLVGSAGGTPVLAKINVPSYQPVQPGKPGEPGTATGVFAIDILRLAGLPPEPQTFFVYAFSRQAAAGPAVMGLVDPPTEP